MWNFSSDEGRVAEESFGEKRRRINYKLITLNTLKNTEYEGWRYCFVSVNKKEIRCILYLCLFVPGCATTAAYSQFREHKCYTVPPHATVALRCRDNKLRLSGFSFCDGPRMDQSRSCLTPPSPQVWTIITISFIFSQPSKLFLPLFTCLVSLFTKGVNWGKWLRNQCHSQPNYRCAISLLWNEIFHITI